MVWKCNQWKWKWKWFYVEYFVCLWFSLIPSLSQFSINWTILKGFSTNFPQTIIRYIFLLTSNLSLMIFWPKMLEFWTFIDFWQSVFIWPRAFNIFSNISVHICNHVFNKLQLYIVIYDAKYRTSYHHVLFSLKAKTLYSYSYIIEKWNQFHWCNISTIVIYAELVYSM